MPDEQGNTKADAEDLPQTSQHAYKEGREDDVAGDLDKLKSGDPEDSTRKEIAGDEDVAAPEPPEKH